MEHLRKAQQWLHIGHTISVLCGLLYSPISYFYFYLDNRFNYASDTFQKCFKVKPFLMTSRFKLPAELPFVQQYSDYVHIYTFERLLNLLNVGDFSGDCSGTI